MTLTLTLKYANLSPTRVEYHHLAFTANSTETSSWLDLDELDVALRSLFGSQFRNNARETLTASGSLVRYFTS
jgi:hypothetical protein